MRARAWSGKVEAMQLTINGETRQVPCEQGAELTVSALLRHLDLKGPVAVEKNREIVPRADHATALVREGDALEIVHFVGGG